MKVVVLMSSYNGQKYIEEQINSILRQKKRYTTKDNIQKSFEVDLLVRDDGSSDGTLNILEKYEREGKLKLYKGENIGAAASFFNLISEAKNYNYYALADQDDSWYPDKLSCAITTLECVQTAHTGAKNNVDIKLYGSNAFLVDDTMKPLGKVYPHKLSLDFKLVSCSCGMLGCTMVFNAELALMVQKYPVPQKAVMHDFYITLLCCAMNGVTVYDECAKILYRQHGNNVCGYSVYFFDKIKKYLKIFRLIPKISIADQAEEMLINYEKYIDQEKKTWLKKIANYRNSIADRILLATSREFHYYSLVRAIPMRVQILLGKI